MKFNQDTRVKLPAILHFMKLGYSYLSLKNQKWDESTNIFKEIFHENILRLNPDMNDADARRLFDEVSLCQENEDLGKAFMKN